MYSSPLPLRVAAEGSPTVQHRLGGAQNELFGAVAVCCVNSDFAGYAQRGANALEVYSCGLPSSTRMRVTLMRSSHMA